MPFNDSRDSAIRNGYTYDHELLMKDAGAITSSAAAQVGGSNKILDLGEAYVEGNLVIDITALDFTTGDETYEIHIQFSDGSDFSGDDVFAQALLLGDARNGFTNQISLGRKVMPFNNRFITTTGAPKNFRYARVYTVCGGTSPSINYVAWIAKLL